MKYTEATSSAYHNLPCVYRLDFPDGSFYIGQTEGLGRRMNLYRHNAEISTKTSPVLTAIRKFGIDAVEINVVCSPGNLNPEDNALARAILEVKYIRELNACEGNGLNIAPGGEILSMPVSYIRTEMTPVAVYSLDGILVDTYPTLSACSERMDVNRSILAKALDNHDMCIDRKYMLVSFDKKPLPSIEPFDRNSLKPYKHEPHQKSPCHKADGSVRRSGWTNLINDFEVEQLDCNGNVVARFSSIKDASVKTNIRYSSIWSCVFGKTYSAYGYRWQKA